MGMVIDLIMLFAVTFFVGVSIGYFVLGVYFPFIECGSCETNVKDVVWCNDTYCDRKFEITINQWNMTYECKCPDVLSRLLDTK